MHRVYRLLFHAARQPRFFPKQETQINGMSSRKENRWSKVQVHIKEEITNFKMIVWQQSSNAKVFKNGIEINYKSSRVYL